MKLSEKILSVFKGRDDCIAMATENGFRPRWLSSPISPQFIADMHLSQQQALGFYLLTPENKCWVSCVDFDNKPEHPDPEWNQKAEKLCDVLTSLGVEPLVEVSQSSNGAHVWLVFEEAVDAWIPRAFWRAVEKKYNLSFREIYPRQDRLNENGVGSLVRYPLWKQSRFVDISNNWETIEPEEALSKVWRTTATNLCEIAGRSGMGRLEQPVSAISGVTDGGLPLRVKRLAERDGTLLASRWGGNSRGMKDQSASAIAESIATELVRAYVPTQEIIDGLHWWCSRNNCNAYERRSQDQREAWVRETVAKAYGFVIDRTTEHKSEEVKTFQACAVEFVQSLENGGVPYIGTGIPELDSSVEGTAPGEMTVVAARPGHGKSAFAMQWLEHATLMGNPCLFISNEMSSLMIGKRRLLSITNIGQDAWSFGVKDQLFEDIEQFHKDRQPVYMIEDCFSVKRATAVIDQMVQLYGVKLVAVDYLQLLRADGAQGRYETVTEASRGLKECAKRNNVALLALCQTSREFEKEGRDPRLSDLRESGQIEQDADSVIFLSYPHRMGVTKDPYEYRVIFAKRRNGPINEAKVITTFDPYRQLFGGAQ